MEETPSKRKQVTRRTRENQAGGTVKTRGMIAREACLPSQVKESFVILPATSAAFAGVLIKQGSIFFQNMNILNVDIRGKHSFKIEKIKTKPNIACKEIPFGLFFF